MNGSPLSPSVGFPFGRCCTCLPSLSGSLPLAPRRRRRQWPNSQNCELLPLNFYSLSLSLSALSSIRVSLLHFPLPSFSSLLDSCEMCSDEIPFKVPPSLSLPLSPSLSLSWMWSTTFFFLLSLSPSSVYVSALHVNDFVYRARQDSLE